MGQAPIFSHVLEVLAVKIIYEGQEI
jgi:hypothetical protein